MSAFLFIQQVSNYILLGSLVLLALVLTIIGIMALYYRYIDKTKEHNDD